MNQSAAFKDFFLIPWPRIRYLAIPRLEYLTALSYGFSYRFLSSFPSHRFSIPFSSLPFNVGDGLFVGNALRDREREREKKGSHLKLETRRKRSGCYVVACDPVLGLILERIARTRAWVEIERKRRIS